MPAGARRCYACGTYQGMPYLPVWTTVLTMLGGTITVATAVVSAWFFISDYRSHTEFKVARADQKFIYLKVWNTGRKPAALVGYRLRFDDIPDKEAVLKLRNDDEETAKNVISSGSPVDIVLRIPVWKTLPADELAKQFTATEVQALPHWASEQKMTLVIYVQESSDDAGEHHTREDRFKSERVSAFIDQYWGPKEPAGPQP
ncbi:MAG: hypothetical protein ACREMY_20435 [bacterium]